MIAHSIFPANSAEITAADLSAAQRQSEGYFRTHAGSEQIQIDRGSREWVCARIPECWRIIKHGTEVIGSTFCLPTTADQMQRFISAAISEYELFEEVRPLKSIPGEALYLCSAFVLPAYRGQGLAVAAALQTLTWFCTRNPRPALFAWEYSSDGAKAIDRLEACISARGLRVTRRRK